MKLNVVSKTYQLIMNPVRSSFSAIIILFITQLIVTPMFGQSSNKVTQNVLRINAINPGVEIEMAVFSKSTISANLGVGFGNMYENTASSWATGEIIYMTSPFADVEYKYFYNFKKRESKGKNLDFNSGNFFSFRCLGRGKAIESNFTRYEDYDLAFGANWGIQRSFKRVHLLFELGAIYYTDGTRNGFAPSLQFNLGYDIFKF